MCVFARFIYFLVFFCFVLFCFFASGAIKKNRPKWILVYEKLELDFTS